MTQESKELILKDICGRLPYGTIVQISLYRNDEKRSDIELDPHVTENIWEIIDKYHALPYLRPMSSMTEEEKKIQKTYIYHFSENNLPNYEGDFVFEDEVHEYIDWLNANHFDYRGLIGKGLAIEVTESNNPYE